MSAVPGVREQLMSRKALSNELMYCPREDCLAPGGALSPARRVVSSAFSVLATRSASWQMRASRTIERAGTKIVKKRASNIPTTPKAMRVSVRVNPPRRLLVMSLAVIVRSC